MNTVQYELIVDELYSCVCVSAIANCARTFRLTSLIMATQSKENSIVMDKLLSVAYSEIEGSKSGEKELAFIEGVFDFLNRQSTYLSNKKTCDKLIKLTNKTIENASKKQDAINKNPKKAKKKKKEKVFTKTGKHPTRTTLPPNHHNPQKQNQTKQWIMSKLLPIKRS